MVVNRAALCTRTALSGSLPQDRSDAVAVEEPLEIRVAGESVAVTMRSPGDDVELALGFLLAEGVIGSARDVGAVTHCGREGEEGSDNVIEVKPAPGAALDPDRVAAARRGTLTASACGVCGRRSIDDLLDRCEAIHDECGIDAAVLRTLPSAMRREQALFAQTGGVHAAALFDLAGNLRAIREDIGRHNAVDKLVGSLVLSRALPAAASVLLVSGRASFEMVQKAIVARVPIVASVSAATSLAIDLANRMNVTLVAFLRDGAMNVYSGRQRVAF